MIRAGCPAPLGASSDQSGTNFAVFSSVAERVQLCLFDEAGRDTGVFDLPERTDDVWHGYLPGCRPGQRYGYRVDGPWDPTAGQRCNPAQLLLDPYARALVGSFRWVDAVFDFDRRKSTGKLSINADDSAPHVPKSVVCGDFEPLPGGPSIPWRDTIFYEAHVRGYTMRHPALNAADRGTFDGMRHAAVLGHIKALGITSLELMPVHAFLDEHHLAEKGLRNFWGYNTISFFSPSARYAKSDAGLEFRDMVRAIHDAGIEVILDVVYNHTAEGGSLGPTLSFRGLDNLAYYSTEPGSPGAYINDTGCGNTLNADHPRLRELVLDSLRYWHKTMGVDGFRFDLAPVLGRHNHGFSNAHPLLAAISSDETLRAAKLVAEPWDPGPGGYQLGNFPARWLEWNDRFRDDVRRFWRGDRESGAALAKRLHGSADVFENSGRVPHSSVNLVTSHDGFTLADLVSYEYRHNEANGEDNQDGHAHNFSSNHGVEGPTDDPAILAARRRQRLNLLATSLFSQGVPLLLAGDEFGHSQRGNNNAYAQDNEVAWLDWGGLDGDPQYLAAVRQLVGLRRETALLRLPAYVHGRLEQGQRVVELEWLNPDGQALHGDDWRHARAFCMALTDAGAGGRHSVLLLINGSEASSTFRLREIFGAGDPRLAFSSSGDTVLSGRTANLPPLTVAILR